MLCIPCKISQSIMRSCAADLLQTMIAPIFRPLFELKKQRLSSVVLGSVAGFKLSLFSFFFSLGDHLQHLLQVSD